MSAEEILIVLLSVSLIFFLVVAIVFFIHLIKISRKVSTLTDKVDQAADNVVSVSDAMRKVATPLALGSAVSHIVDKVFKSKKGRSTHGKKKSR